MPAYTPTEWSPVEWSGRWQWNPSLSHYSDNRQIASMNSEIRVSGIDLFIHQRFILGDGTSAAWYLDTKFDGAPRPIRWDHDDSEMIDIAFYVMQPGLGGDIFTTRDGSKMGAEFWRIMGDRYEATGSFALNGAEQFTYREIFDRID